MTPMQRIPTPQLPSSHGNTYWRHIVNEAIGICTYQAGFGLLIHNRVFPNLDSAHADIVNGGQIVVERACSF
jgi:hypothetical protein